VYFDAIAMNSSRAARANNARCSDVSNRNSASMENAGTA